MPNHKRVTYSERPNHAARRAHAQGERAFKTYDTSFIRPKRSKAPAIIGIVVLVVAVIAIVFGIVSFFRGCTPESNLIGSNETAQVVVSEGEGATAIAKTLVSEGLITDANKFTDRVAELGASASLKTGVYSIKGGTSVDNIIALLQAGTAGSTFTVPEGTTLANTAAIVSAATEGRISESDFIAAASDASVYASDYSFLADAGTNSLEGFLFPKTYTYDDTSTADSIIRTMLDQFQKETAGLDWSYAQSQGLNIYQAVNLASIVEKESSGDDAIRAKVASVFYNRLTTDGDPSYGLLQSDATTAYEVGHDPTAEEVHSDSAYSTYTNKGLPPTPICSPSLACLQAVCSPDTDALGKYYFFYFEGDQYYFSETYEEHQSTYE